MLNKRILSFLLAVVLVVGLMPTSVFASETEGTTAPSESVPETTGEAVVLTDDGEGEEGDPAPVWCELCQVNDCGKTHTQCEACGTWDCETEHKYCEKCEKYDCGKAHVVCEICKVEDCGVTHEQCDLCGQYDCDGNDVFCEKCRIWNCGIDHDAACGKCGVPGCTSKHIWCDTCQKEDCGVSHVWCETCQKNDCGVDHTVTDPSEETTVPEEEETEPAGPQVGDKIWIKSGAKVYKNLNNDKSWTLLGNYEVEIEAIETDEAGNPQWYRFKFTTLGLGEMMLHSYKYVAVADTVEEQPEEETVAEETEKLTTVGATSIQVSGVIPENVNLTAEAVEIPQTSTFGVEDESPKLVFAYDIKLVDEEGNEWQPEDGETVTVTLDAESLDLEDGDVVSILHDHDDELYELGEFTVADGKLSFATDGFSVFYGYTVDFEYDGTLHSFTGDSIIFMSDLLKILNIERSVKEISDVTFSDPSLIKVTYANYDPLESNYVEWFLESLQPFDTEELLVITFYDGSIIEINVYDATYNAINGDITWQDGSTVAGCTVQNNATITINGTVTLQGNIVVPAGKTLTIKGGTIKRGFTGTMLSVKDGGTLIIDGTTIDGNDSGSEYSGNALHCKTSKLELKNGAKVINNQGCGIWVDDEDKKGVDVDINNSTIASCRNSAGSAIYLFGNGTGNVNLYRSVIEGCYSKESDLTTKEATGELCSGTIRTNGGGQWKLTLEDCVMRNNTSDGHGGGIYWNARSGGAKLTIKDCQFLNNYALNFGGAIFNEGVCEITATAGTMTEPITSGMPGDIVGTLISGNTAGDLTDADRSEYKTYYDTELGKYQPVNNRGFGGGICVKTYNGGYEDAGSVGAVQLTLGDNIKIANNKAIDGAGLMLYVRELGNVPDKFEYQISVDGATINNNIASDKGGGIYFWNALGKYKTVLSLENGTISNNSAKDGGAAYVENTGVTFGTIEISNNKAMQNGGALYLNQNQSNSDTLHKTNVSSGTLSNNVAEHFGGGIYQTGIKGECTVSGAGSITDNEAANGGGIYLANGSAMTINGGIITDNTATPAATGDTAYNNAAASGVGGGVYVASGALTMKAEGETPVGLYGNNAAFAADDAYASGNGNTALTLPKVTDMPLGGTAYAEVDGWYLDYKNGDSEFDEEAPFTTNPGRYDTQQSGYRESAGETVSGDDFYCLTLGLTPKLVVEKQVLGKERPTESFTFTVKQGNEVLGTVEFDPDDFMQNEDKTAWIALDDSTMNSMPVGSVTVTETFAEKSAYKFTSASTEVTVATYNTEAVTFNMTDNGEKVTFVNELAIADIVITKTVNGVEPDVDEAENQTFVFHVKGTDKNTEDVDMTVVINISPDDVDENGVGTGSVTIKGVPIGAYTVTEDEGWSWRYTATNGTVSKSITSDIDDNYFPFTNNRDKIYWLSGDSYCENNWGTTDGLNN